MDIQSLSQALAEHLCQFNISAIYDKQINRIEIHADHGAFKGIDLLTITFDGDQVVSKYRGTLTTIIRSIYDPDLVDLIINEATSIMKNFEDWAINDNQMWLDIEAMTDAATGSKST